MEIQNRQELENEIRMLQGNINRLCVTDDIKEFNSMVLYATDRMQKIFKYNEQRVIYLQNVFSK